MLSLLSETTRQRVKTFSAEFAAAQPFRHVVINEFLDATFCRNLSESFPPFDPERARNEHGVTGRKAVCPALPKLGPEFATFDRLLRDPSFLDFISRITGIPHLLYDPDYEGGGTHENLNGAELDSHVDFNYHPRRQWHRRLNLIVFLNEDWQEVWGGCLELLRDPWATSTGDRRVIVPRLNRAVIFETTEKSWHGFRHIQLPIGKNVSRRSIAVYFYTKDRDSMEIAPSHGTIYYQRSLPDRIQAGYTLQADDVRELQDLLARRDHHMKFLYEREQEFSSVLSGITRSPSFRVGRSLTWPLRALLRKWR